eukprot:1159089-Pelagomonas_calceolata.AAC.3
MVGGVSKLYKLRSCSTHQFLAAFDLPLYTGDRHACFAIKCNGMEALGQKDQAKAGGQMPL